MNTLNEIYPHQSKPIGVGSFLRAPDGELFIVGCNAEPGTNGKYGVGLASLSTGRVKSNKTVGVTEGELAALTRDQVERMIQDTLGGWLVLSRDEAAKALAGDLD